MELGWSFYIYVILFSLLIGTIPLAFKKRNRLAHQVILSVIFIGALTEVVGAYYGNRGVNNSWVYNLGFLYLETVFLWFYFLILFNKQQLYRKIFVLSFIFFSLWFAFNSTYLQGFWYTFQTYTVVISSLSIILYSLWFFYLVTFKNLLSEENLLWTPAFWVVCFVFFFYTASFMHFASMSYLIGIDRKLIEALGLILTTLSGMMYLALGIAYNLPYFSRICHKVPEKD